MKRPAPVFWRGAFVFPQFIPHSDDFIALNVIKFTALKKHEVPFPVTKPIPAQIVWFKRDLRLHDHEPLFRALVAGPVLPLYIIEPSILYAPDFDASHYVFVRQSLRELREELANLGQPQIVRQGRIYEVRNRPETQRLADEIRFKHGSRRPVFNGRLKEMRWNGQLRMDFQEEGQLTLAGNSR